MSTPDLISLSLSGRESGPIFMQIHDQIRARIAAGRIAPGTRLPSSRALAADLGLARATVVAAYEQLVAEGYAEARPGAGVFATDAGAMAGVRPPPMVRRSRPAPPPRPLLLRPGVPDVSLFPAQSWARTVARVARNEARALHSCADRFGDPALRSQIARHLQGWRGIAAEAEQIVITAGSGEALELALEVAGAQAGGVALENPGYGPIRQFAQSRGWRVLDLAVDREGAVLPEPNAGGAGAVVLTPSHQYPLGGAMARGRRAGFLARAEAEGFWIIEDDFDSEFRYGGRPIPALAALDTAGRTIYVGSFSKVFSHGIRLGYMVLPEALVAAARTRLAGAPTRASVVGQRPLARFIESGTYARHLRRVRRVYARRYGLLVRVIDAGLAEFGQYGRHNAGMSLAFHLERGIDDQEVVRRARIAGVGCLALSGFAAGKAGVNGLLLGFCETDETEIARAVREVWLAVRDVAAAG